MYGKGRKPDEDGKDRWQLFKCLMDDIAVVGKWVPLIEVEIETYTRLDTLERVAGDEMTHFRAQIYRIRLEKPCTLRRVAQLTYNIGQHHAADPEGDGLYVR